MAIAEAVSMGLRHGRTIHSLESNRHASIKEGIKYRNSNYLLWDELTSDVMSSCCMIKQL